MAALAEREDRTALAVEALTSISTDLADMKAALQEMAETELIAARAKARQHRCAAAWHARVAGLSIRRIGELLGVSHVTVLRLARDHERAVGLKEDQP